LSEQPPTYDPSDFSLLPGVRRIEKPWGHELLLSPEDAPYTSKLIHVKAGHRLSLQLHDSKTETQTLIQGKGILVLEGSDGELHNVEMEPNVGYSVAIGQRHRLCAAPDQDAVIFEASTPETGTTYRLEDDYRRPDETEDRRQQDRRQAP
jgi:mannose-6-phosphate isomerase-like protein (cupin superfamily)